MTASCESVAISCRSFINYSKIRLSIFENTEFYIKCQHKSLFSRKIYENLTLKEKKYVTFLVILYDRKKTHSTLLFYTL